MGISGLARHLEPYTTRHAVGNLNGYCAIIDGPALAYHAHKLALAASASHSRIPSYADIIDQGIRWLKSLESLDIKVSMVFFDGDLPPEKRPERLLRTQQNNNKVKQLRARYPNADCPMYASLGSKLYAFLAPAFRESLSKSAFASRTFMVPGEADDWCAIYARKEEHTIVFTNDTDLLLFTYPPETLISFFQDADLSTNIRAFSPKNICEKLKLRSLILFAFALQQDSSDSTKELIRKAKDVHEDSMKYTEFSQRYTLRITGPYLNTVMVSPQLQNLDPRVSEYVHQARNNAELIYVYSPLLTEDPNFASAWAMGQSIRTLAYSLLAPPNSTICEYKRRAQNITVQKIYPYATANIHIPAFELNRQISSLLNWTKLKAIGTTMFWPLFALNSVLTETNVPPPISLVLRILNSDFDNTWSFIQLTARLQAALYSLRMLKQIIKIWLTLDPQPEIKLFEHLSALDAHFNNFPVISEMFSVPGQKVKVLMKVEDLKVLVEEIYTSVGVQAPNERVQSKTKKKKAREAERKRRKAEEKGNSENAFAVLAE